MGRSLGNMERVLDLRWSGKGLQEVYFGVFINVGKNWNEHMNTMLNRNVGKNAESTMGISSWGTCTLCAVALIFFWFSFKKIMKKIGILVPSIDGESVSPFSLSGLFCVTHCILCAVISTNPISRHIL